MSGAQRSVERGEFRVTHAFFGLLHDSAPELLLCITHTPHGHTVAIAMRWKILFLPLTHQTSSLASTSIST